MRALFLAAWIRFWICMYPYALSDARGAWVDSYMRVRRCL